MLANLFFITATAATMQGGIYTYGFTPEGVLQQVAFTQVDNASYLAFSNDRKYLFAAIEGPSGGVASFKINDDKSLTLISLCSEKGFSTCHLTQSPKGEFLFAANYGQGCIQQYRIQDGVISPTPTLIQHTGKGVHPTRQTKPHVHYTCISPDKKYLCVIDLGLDLIRCYPITSEGIQQGNYKETLIQPLGSGPRHITFSQDGERAFLVNELASTVSLLLYKDGTFEMLQTLPLLKPFYNGIHTGSAIKLSRDEKLLIVSNRGYDILSTFRVEGKKLLPLFSTLSGGSYPRDCELTADNKKLIVGNEKSSNVFVMDLDATTGILTPDGNTLVDMPRPICILTIE